MTATAFHFSPRPNRAHEIAWNEWSADAFERAQREDKPILLGISAVWCHWCHVMDETSYSDPDVISLINDRFVPVRVDNDLRPDVNARYNMGGWPTTAFLTPAGEVMAGMTYVAPEQMRDILNQVSTYYKDNKTLIEQKIAERLAGRTATATDGDAPAGYADGAPSDQILRDVLDSCTDAYDPVHGGFGNEPKFPHTGAIDLLLRAYLRDGDRDALHMARKTLERMCAGGTYDQEWGGFYRYSTKRDWSVPHYEKMLEDNALLLKNLCALYRVSGAETHRRYIDFTVDYIDRWLSDTVTGAFYGSQDADEEFYPLPAAERRRRTAPYVDPRVYASWNAMMISAYLEASWTRGRPNLRDRALRALDYLWSALYRDGAGMHRYLDAGGAPQIGGLLGDQAWTALALLDAHEVAGRAQDLQRARALTDFMLARLLSPEGAFYDAPPGGDSLGKLSMRLTPVKENSWAAEALIRLARITHKARYEGAARRALAPFAGIAESQGYFAAEYARAVDMLLNPGADVKIVVPADADRRDAAPGEAQLVEDSPERAASASPAARSDVAPRDVALHAAALALPVPDRIVRLIDASDAAALDAESLPPHPAPAAYACYGTLCSAPVTTPDELVEIVERTRQAYQSTRPKEPLALPRSDREGD